jgi:multiple sugar transport system ATP-binding protein
MRQYPKPKSGNILRCPLAHFYSAVDNVDVVDVVGDQATVRNAALDPVTLTIRHPGIVAGGKARLGVRPQYLSPDAQLGAGVLHGKIVLTERLGAETIVEAMTTDGKPLIVALARDAKFDIGSEISLRFDPEFAHLFAV